MPLSSRWQLWVRGREGPPLPQSALPGPRACVYERHSFWNRQWSATVLPPTMARGPPRSNVSGMRLSSLASPFIWMRASCHLRTSCRVGIGCDSLSSAALQIKSQEPSLRGIFYYPPAPPKGDFKLLARSSPELTPAMQSPNLPSARSLARLFLSCPPFVPHYGTPVTDSQCGIPIGMFMSGHAIRGCGQFLRGRRHCLHSGRASLQRTESALLRSLPRSHPSLPADSSCVADCLQSPLPDPLQTAPPPLRNSPCPGGRTLPLQPEWHTASTRLSVQAAE